MQDKPKRALVMNVIEQHPADVLKSVRILAPCFVASPCVYRDTCAPCLACRVCRFRADVFRFCARLFFATGPWFAPPCYLLTSMLCSTERISGRAEADRCRQ
jgi:hypothetical protein